MGTTRIPPLAALAAGVWMGVASTGGIAADLNPTPAVPPKLAQASPWEFNMVAYGWAAGIKGNMATLPPAPAIDVNIGFDKVLQNLEGAFMGAGELKYGRLIFLTDLMYSKLGANVTPRGPIVDRATLTSTSIIGTFAAGYRLVEDPNFSIDAMAGVRGYSIGTKIQTISRVPALNIVGNDTETWADPMIGIKARYNFTSSLYLTSWGWIGGFGVGSKVSWDVFGGLGYSFNDRVSAFAGYRALGIDYSRNGFVYNVVQQGPITGLVFRF